ncbi:hypothetical protein RXV95_15200 [Novosphingobium sp. ZN18A2]|uniref:hypothetical protein n=1 Tax=Novosphingobium sp. ZN18A2 TaxID=3079861 RepID=UPI0030D1C1C7
MIATRSPDLSLAGTGAAPPQKSARSEGIAEVFADVLKKQPGAAASGRQAGTQVAALPESGKDLPAGKAVPASGKSGGAPKTETPGKDAKGEGKEAAADKVVAPVIAPQLPYPAAQVPVALAPLAASDPTQPSAPGPRGATPPRSAPPQAPAPIAPRTPAKAHPPSGAMLPNVTVNADLPTGEDAVAVVKVGMNGKTPAGPVVRSASAPAPAPETQGEAHGAQDKFAAPAAVAARRDTARAEPARPETPASPAASPLATAPFPRHDAAAPATPPHAASPERLDFAQLVDSIARARQDAGTQPVRISLDHAEFGAVSLKFRHEGDALSVQMASTDPGFARAVAATHAADPGQMRHDQPQHGEAAQGQSRGDTGSDASRGQQNPHTASHAGGQSHSGAGDQPHRQARGTAANNPPHGRATQTRHRGEDASGRFA